jgi:hypothetical protein
MSDEPAKAEPIDETSAQYWKAKYDQLEHDLRMWGVIEIMVRNPQVSEYIGYLEGEIFKDASPHPAQRLTP